VARKFLTSLSVEDLASAASQALGIKVYGDTFVRLSVDAGGKLTWSGGASAGDLNLYRTAAGHLKSDQIIEAAGGVITLTTSGVPTATIDDGALAVDTNSDNLYLRSNGAWVPAGGGASVTVSDNAPSSPTEGDMWFESDTGDIYVYYDSVWVDVGGSSVANIAMSDTAPTQPTNGDFWFETDTARTFVYYVDGDSSQWVEVGATSAAAVGDEGYIQYYSGGALGGASALVWDSASSSLDIVGDITATGTVSATSGITGDLTGNASTASTLATARTIQVSGDVAGSASFDGSADINITTTIQANSVALTTDTTGDYVESLVQGTGVTLTNNTGEGATPTIAIGQPVGTTDSVIFNLVTADLIGNVTGNSNTASTLQTARSIGLGGDLSGSALFDGSADITISATINADSVALGTDTVGDYIESLVAGTGITLTNNSGEGSTPTIEIGQDVATTSNVTFNDVTVSGNLTVSGNTTTVDTATLSVEDPLIILASGNNTTDVVDIGFYGLYDTSGSQDLYAGLFRDATDGKFRLFTDSQTAPTTTVDTAATGYTVANLVANIEGSLTGNADSADILSTARTFTLSGDVSGSVSFDGSADVTISTTIQADSVALGTDTTGDYVESLVAGTGVTLSNNTGEGATPTVEIGQSVGTADDVTFNTVTGTNGVITLTSSGAPTSTLADGAIAIDTTNNILYFRSGSSWQQVSGGVEISDAPPSSANEGDLWWESDTGRLKVYYNDGTSTQWVDAFTSGAGSASSGAMLWTQFYYDGGTGPTGSTTGTLGENHGTWYEATAANYANTGLGSNNSANDPTLTGITYSSGTGRFTGFPQGVYQVSFTGNAAIDATGLTISQQKGIDISGNGIFVDFPISILPEAAYHNYPNFETGFSLSTTVVMYDSNAANNYIEISAGTQNTWYYAYYGYLSVTKVG
jgi:hypothetical protein